MGGARAGDTEKIRPLVFVKVKAHQSDMDLRAADWEQWRCATGNELADQCANFAAEDAQLDENTVRDVEWLDRVCTKVCGKD